MDRQRRPRAVWLHDERSPTNQKSKHNTGQQANGRTQYLVMRTGELARRAGVNIETLRFYERQKLLRPPMRTAGGYRDYTDGDLETVCFIKQCQHLGFTLKEIGQLAELHQVFPKSAASRKPKNAEVAKFRQMSDERLRLIDQKIQALRKMRAELSRLANELRKTKGLVCPAAKK